MKHKPPTALVCAASALLLLAVQPGNAQILSGFDHFSNGDYCKAREVWRKDWARGEAIAAFGMGETYARGLCVEENQRRASEWYLKAAIGGSARARSELGLRYAYGRGVAQSYFKSYVWLLAARMSASPWERTLLDAVQKNMLIVGARISMGQRQEAEAIGEGFARTYQLPALFSELD